MLTEVMELTFSLSQAVKEWLYRIDADCQIAKRPQRSVNAAVHRRRALFDPGAWVTEITTPRRGEKITSIPKVTDP